MYSRRPGFIIGFHGCEEKTKIKHSKNDYDWLGHGIYFWENNYERTLAFAGEKRFKKPSVLGAFIDLGNCLDLLESKNLNIVKKGYEGLSKTAKEYGQQLPKNINPKSHSSPSDILLRRLDCAVINMVHKLYEDQNLPEYDSVRGVFWEGHNLYPGAGMKGKNHIQICIRNENCIKGFFIPRFLR